MGWLLQAWMAACTAGFAAWLALGPAASAQTSPAEATVALRQMAADAGVIFAGQVLAISRHNGAGFVDIRFHVDQAVLGCEAGTIYVLREWAGLWTANPFRYRIGERRLMLLTARSAAGFSSPVSGSAGSIPIVASQPGPIADKTGAAPPDNGTPAAAHIDLRRVQAHALRGDASNPTTVSHADLAAWAGPVTPLAAAGTTATQDLALDAALALLRTRGPSSGVAPGTSRAR